MKKHIEYNGSVLNISLYKAGIGCKEYDCFLQSGPWPEDEDLIILADGGWPDMDVDELMCKSGEVACTEQDDYKLIRVKS